MTRPVQRRRSGRHCATSRELCGAGACNGDAPSYRWLRAGLQRRSVAEFGFRCFYLFCVGETHFAQVERAQTRGAERTSRFSSSVSVTRDGYKDRRPSFLFRRVNPCPSAPALVYSPGRTPIGRSLRGSPTLAWRRAASADNSGDRQWRCGFRPPVPAFGSAADRDVLAGGVFP